MMDFLTFAKGRCSVRDYETKEVEQEKIETILEAARIAPSACNKQPIRIKVIHGEDLTIMNDVYPIFGAPLAFLVCVEEKEAWVRRYDQKNHGDIDATIACDHMMLCASDLGLDSVWVCAFDPEKMKDRFALPEGIQPVNLLVCGYGKAGTKKSSERYEDERKSKNGLLL